jgi:hypothetical protein
VVLLVFRKDFNGMRTEMLVAELARKHHFNLSFPGRALWLEGPSEEEPVSGELVICVCRHDPPYIIGQSYPDRPGFCVYYSPSWQPVRAFNQYGRPMKNLSSADKQMCELVQRYLMSGESFVTELEE